MRTLPAPLQTVMDAGVYDPYIQLWGSNTPTGTGTAVQCMGYELRDLEFKATTPTGQGTYSYYRIERGANVNGTPSTISSMWFALHDYEIKEEKITLICKALSHPNQKGAVTIAANSTYVNVIDTILVRHADTLVASYRTTAWKTYQFYPTDESIYLRERQMLWGLLQQKLAIFATDNGWDGANNNILFFRPGGMAYQEFDDPLYKYSSDSQSRYVIGKDENGTIRTSGTSTNPKHNVGFIHSTSTMPSELTTQNEMKSVSSKLRVHLQRQTGDAFQITYSEYVFPAQLENGRVTEILDLNSDPAWYQIIQPLQKFGNTEGGLDVPESTYKALIYGGLDTSTFGGILSEYQNNTQSAIEVLDDHGILAHDGAEEAIQDIIGAMVSGGTETGIAVTYDDGNNRLDFVAEVTQAELDALSSVYAPIAKGVTNGDSHDHSGGDGGTIAYSSLSGAYTDESIQDIVGAMVSGGTETGIAVTYDDGNNRLDFVAEVTQAELDVVNAKTWNIVKKSADETVTADNTLTADADLTFAVPASTRMNFRGVLYYTTGSSADFKFRMVCGGAAFVMSHSYTGPGASTFTTSKENAVPTTTVSIASSGTNTGIVFFEGILEGDAGGDTFQIEWAGNNAVETTTLLKGSYVEYRNS